MQNNPEARDRRRRVAAENAANRAQRTDQQQIDWLKRAGHTAAREIARLTARIAEAKK